MTAATSSDAFSVAASLPNSARNRRLQRDLFAKVKTAVRPDGLVVAIVHTPDTGERWSANRTLPGELRGFFNDWEVLWDYEGPSRDPAHRRPVAEIVAQRDSLTPGVSTAFLYLPTRRSDDSLQH